MTTKEKNIQSAQLRLVERALLEFVEAIDNRVPSDDEILSCGQHVQLPVNADSTYSADGNTWNLYYVWRRRHALALGFLDAADPLLLTYARVPAKKWPASLRCYVALRGQKKETE
jgi:hypothetical protein